LLFREGWRYSPADPRIDYQMPELSRFYGIIIRMFSEPTERHHVPHFHAYHQENVAIFGIEPVEMVAGSLPQRQQRLVEAWAELHKEELLSDWELLQNGKRPAQIEPLR
jgi:Domain of unknown function (DUF4160)